MFSRPRFHAPLLAFLGILVLAALGCGESNTLSVTPGSALAVNETPLIPFSPSIQYNASVKWDELLIPDSRFSNNKYSVKVKIKNNGDTPLLFDYAEGSFFATNMKGLSVRDYSMEPSPAQGPKTKVTEINPGEEHVCSFDTETYTDDLLSNAGEGWLFFKVALYLEDKQVDWSGVAILPRLEELKADKQSRSLTFTR